MNDDELSAFEKELAELKPRAPSARLRAQLDAMVDGKTGDQPRATRPAAPPPAFRWQRHGTWLAAAAGLAFALVVLWWQPFVDRANDPDEVETAATEVVTNAGSEIEQKPALARSSYRPLKARNSLRNRIDEGMVTLENGLFARRFRFQFVDTVVWENPQDGSQFEVSTPREEVVLVPVHTF